MDNIRGRSNLKKLTILLAILVLGLTLFAQEIQLEAVLQNNEAGFVTIEPIDFSFHFGSHFNRLALRSSKARLWYVFQPVDQNITEKPVFVFFNGGPGSATSSGLLSMYTSRLTLDNSLESGGEAFISNPVSWTRLGNLLYIDARQTGFSYNIMGNSLNYKNTMGNSYNYFERLKEFNAQNFNAYFDAADFVRVILRFLSKYPDLQDNPVIIVGESYGGIRASAILHILLNYTDYADGDEMYQDPSLVDEIQAHYNVVFPNYSGQEVPPEVINKQFGHQILIQPALSLEYQNQMSQEMFEQEGSIIYQISEEIAEEEGIDYDPSLYNPSYFITKVAKRDYYNYTQPEGWLAGFFLNAGKLLQFTDNLSLVTGTDVTTISHLYASVRWNAYKVISIYSEGDTINKQLPFEQLYLKTLARREAKLYAENPGDLNEIFGILDPWDRYFLGINVDAHSAFFDANVANYRGYNIGVFEPCYGKMFLKNVVHINTFITNAAYDLVIYSPALPSVFDLYHEVLESVIHDTLNQAGETRPGRIILNYRPDAFPDIQNPNTRMIRFPFYAHSGHAVSLTEPVELFTDVIDWLNSIGLSNENWYWENIK